MSPSFIRSNERYAWHGQSLLITNERGDCGSDNSLSGYYFREARHLRTMRIEINGVSPWLCESAASEADSLLFSYVHPELTVFGGGGSGQSQDATTRDRDGIPHRSLDIVVAQQVGIASLDVSAVVTNRSREPLTFEFAWIVDADFADIQEALEGQRQQSAAVFVEAGGDHVEFVYQHDRLGYRTTVSATGGWVWTANDWRLATRLRLDSQQPTRLSLRVEPADYRDMPDGAELERTETLWRHWRESFARVQVPGNRVAEEIVRSNLRDLSSFPLLLGKPDEWLAPQAGMPLYPALFGRDAFTAGWQAGWVDRGRMLDAALTRLGRMQSTRVEDWTDEEPGRVPYQVRLGPLARLNINPYSAYYADFASPMMFIISLAHAFAWTGDMELLDRHWSTALGILQWLEDYGDRDGDGYLEYLTKSPKGTKNQGWKDSGNAILYEDGSPVPAPLGTCELQGYWFASLQLMSALNWTRGDLEQARELWQQAMELKRRFNRDWWMEEESYIALALDSDKKQVRALTSNVGQCISTGIIDDEHLPRVVGRLFAPDLFSGWGIRTLSTSDRSYNPLEYHLGSVWAVENASIVFGLARFGFWERAADLAEGLFSLATLYPDYRIPETVGGYARSERPFPGAYPRSNTPQLWNASVFPLLLQALLGLQPLAPIHTLIADPHLPSWLPAVTIDGICVGDARATLRFWRDRNGDSHGEILHSTGTLHLLKQPPIESLTQGLSDRLGAAVDTVLHH